MLLEFLSAIDWHRLQTDRQTADRQTDRLVARIALRYLNRKSSWRFRFPKKRRHLPTETADVTNFALQRK